MMDPFGQFGRKKLHHILPHKTLLFHFGPFITIKDQFGQFPYIYLGKYHYNLVSN